MQSPTFLVYSSQFLLISDFDIAPSSFQKVHLIIFIQLFTLPDDYFFWRHKLKVHELNHEDKHLLNVGQMIDMRP